MTYEQQTAEALRWAREMVAGGQSVDNAYAICLKDWREVHGYVSIPFEKVLLPTYPSPGPGYEWQVRTDAVGPRGMWVFEGNRNATGVGIQPTETVAQYAMRMGLPASIAFTFASAAAVDAELAGKKRPNEVLKSNSEPVFAVPAVPVIIPTAPQPTPPEDFHLPGGGTPEQMGWLRTIMDSGLSEGAHMAAYNALAASLGYPGATGESNTAYNVIYARFLARNLPDLYQ